MKVYICLLRLFNKPNVVLFGYRWQGKQVSLLLQPNDWAFTSGKQKKSALRIKVSNLHRRVEVRANVALVGRGNVGKFVYLDTCRGVQLENLGPVKENAVWGPSPNKKTPINLENPQIITPFPLPLGPWVISTSFLPPLQTRVLETERETL